MPLTTSYREAFYHADTRSGAGSKTTLAQAIGIAEQGVGGRAYEAEVDRDGDVVEYDVTVLKADGSEHMIEISADGQVKSRWTIQRRQRTGGAGRPGLRRGKPQDDISELVEDYRRAAQCATPICIRASAHLRSGKI